MSVIGKLKEVGLESELDSLLRKYLKGNDESALKSLRDSIDSTGLKSPKTMKEVGSLQRVGKLEPGLYKELVALNKRLESGEVTETKESAAPEEEPAKSGDEVTEATQETTSEVKVEVENLDDSVLSEKEENRIKERMKKEEEKMRKRLLEREAKMRERILARHEKRAQRQGVKVETIQGVKERKDKLAEIREQMKELRDQSKKLRDEINELKPKRPRKKKKDKAAEAPAAEAAE